MNSIRNKYSQLGVETFYKENADNYQNPHEPIIQYLIQNYLSSYPKNIKILDLACGNGEVTKTLTSMGFSNIKGLDPFTYKQYKSQTQRYCYQLSFKDIVQGKLNETFDLVICSFALHLVPPSMLDQLLYQLNSKELIVLTPNKKPIIQNFFELSSEKTYKRVRFRHYLRVV